MIDDRAGAIDLLRTVLRWLDANDMWRAAIDIDSAIARLDAAQTIDTGVNPPGITGLLH